jgi:hypothetical protein
MKIPPHIPLEYINAVKSGEEPRVLRVQFNISSRTEREWRRIIRIALEDGEETPEPIVEKIVIPELPPTASMEELWLLMEEMQRCQQAMLGTLCKKYVKITTDKPIGVVFLSDMHIGSSGTDHVQLRKHIDMIADTPGLYVFLGGDAVDNFILSSLIHASRTDVVRPMVQYRLLEYILHKIKDKVIAVGDGNHTSWTKQLADVDMLGEITKGWPVVYTGNGGIVELIVGEVPYRIYRQHKGRFNSAFNLTHTVKRAWEFSPDDFDIGIGEHMHQPSVEPFTRHSQRKVAICTGTYKVYDEWALANGMYGADIGTPLVILYPNEKRIIVPEFMDDLGRAVRYLKLERDEYKN